jgi:hypothetical protein
VLLSVSKGRISQLRGGSAGQSIAAARVTDQRIVATEFAAR